MDVEVIFQRSGGDPFTMKVDVYLDTVLKIKAKIQKLQGIPISQQTLIFQGKILSDHCDLLLSNINHKSTIHLRVSPPPEFTIKLVSAMIEDLWISAEKEFPPLMDRKTAEICLPPLTQAKFITAAGGDQLPPSSAKSSGGISSSSSSTSVKGNAKGKGRADEDPAADANRSKKKARVDEDERAVTVVVEYNGERSRIMVGRDDKVSSLKLWLELVGANVPDGPYFFVHNRTSMEEDKTFRYHGVADEDEISVLFGRIMPD